MGYDYKVAWMDCETASSGNWHQSYRALEKLYAEGKVGAIFEYLNVGILQNKGRLRMWRLAGACALHVS
jgi:hypothetical protein